MKDPVFRVKTGQKQGRKNKVYIASQKRRSENRWDMRPPKQGQNIRPPYRGQMWHGKYDPTTGAANTRGYIAGVYMSGNITTHYAEHHMQARARDNEAYKQERQGKA